MNKSEKRLLKRVNQAMEVTLKEDEQLFKEMAKQDAKESQCVLDKLNEQGDKHGN